MSNDDCCQAPLVFYEAIPTDRALTLSFACISKFQQVVKMTPSQHENITTILTEKK